MAYTDNVEVQVGVRSMPLTIAGSGAPCLLIHGYPLARTTWSSIWEGLREDRLVIAPDLRGFGDAAEEASEFSLADLAHDLAELIHALDIRQKVTLIGLSMGGYVALEYWASFGEQIENLVLCDTRAGIDSDAARQTRLDTANKVFEVGVQAVTIPMIDKLLCKKSRDAQPNLVAELKQIFENTPPSTIAHAQRAMAARRDFTDRLSEIKIPTLAICGEQDVITPVGEMQSMASKIEGATFAAIPDAGHLPPMENPAATLAAIRSFLDRKNVV